MKKTLPVVLLIGLLGVCLTAPAFAGWWGRGPAKGCGPGLGAGCGKGPCYSADKDENLDKARQAFRSESQELRQLLHGKRGLYRELMQQDSPNKDEAAKLWSEIFDLQSKLQQMAATAGIVPGNSRGLDGADASGCQGNGCGYGRRGGWGCDCGGPL